VAGGDLNQSCRRSRWNRMPQIIMPLHPPMSICPAMKMWAALSPRARSTAIGSPMVTTDSPKSERIDTGMKPKKTMMAPRKMVSAPPGSGSAAPQASRSKAMTAEATTQSKTSARSKLRGRAGRRAIKRMGSAISTRMTRPPVMIPLQRSLQALVDPGTGEEDERAQAAEQRPLDAVAGPALLQELCFESRIAEHGPEWMNTAGGSRSHAERLYGSDRLRLKGFLNSARRPVSKTGTVRGTSRRGRAR
jgi:hypothetical protein